MRLARWAGGMAGGLVLLLALILWTAPGHRLIGWIIFRVSAGEVYVQGLDGALPGHAVAQTIELRDPEGPWLRISGVDLTWSPFSVLRNHYEIQQLSAAKVSLLRRPLPSPPSDRPSPRIDVYALSLPHIDIAPSLLGHAAMLTAHGSLNYTSMHEFGVDIVITRPGGPDRYAAKASVSHNVIHGIATIAESPDGLFGKLAGLPGLGPVALMASASGDRNANEVSFDLTAGALTAAGKGTLSLASGRADVDFSANSSAMQLDPETSWASLVAEGHVHGQFAALQIDASLHLAQAHVAGLAMDSVSAQARGQAGKADARATITGLHISAPYSGLFAATPVEATLHADLVGPTRPLQFTIRHPLLVLDGTAQTAGARNLRMNFTVPVLAPFAKQVGTNLGGQARLNIAAAWTGQKFTVDMQGGIHAAGTSVLARMLGRDARLSFHTLVSGSDLEDSRVQLQGAGFDSRIEGSFRGGRMNFRLDTGLTDLAQLTPVLEGNARLSGTVTGAPARASIKLAGPADIASRGFKRQRLVVTVIATGLPQPSAARLTGKGRFDDAPIALVADWNEAGRGHAAKLTLDWKSLVGRADITLAPNSAVGGHATLNVKNLGDLTSFAGFALAGSVKATADLGGRNGREQIGLHMDAHALHAHEVALGAFEADGAVTDAFGAPQLDIHLNAQGLSADGITGNAKAQLTGSAETLAATISADLKDKQAQPAHVSADIVAQPAKLQIRLDRLAAEWRGQEIALAQPANFNLANGVSVDRLDLKAMGGMLHVAGRLLPRLALNATASGVRLSALRASAPQWAAVGMLNAKADLSGMLRAPSGDVTLSATGLRVSGYSSNLPAAELSARARLDGNSAQLNAKLSAGNAVALTVGGTAPLASDRAMDLHAAGNGDLALFNPFVAAAGRQVRGRVTLDIKVTGPIAAPRLAGSASVVGAEFQDYAQGLRLSEIAAHFRAVGSVIRIETFEARAGPGSISGGGTLDTGQAGWPVDITVSARNARPIASDMVVASLSGDLKLTGRLRQSMTLAGKLTVPRAEINIPDSFPPEVRTLNIRRRGEKPPPPAPGSTKLMLNLGLTTTGPVIVRGHGIDADMGGQLQLTGSTGAPQVAGAFEMRRGTLTVAGQVLEFTAGKLSFDGSGVRNRLDPTLNFVAQTTSSGVTATLAVGGYASSPKITLSSSPQLPQDEILAHLLFQQSSKQLTPLQLAQIAQALASLSGISNGFDPVASIRGGLGLDRLAVSGGSGVTTGTTIEAGKYVSHNIYVGARQGLSGGTQAQVQVDITRNLKAQATVSSGSSPKATQGAAAQDSGDTIGLSYQFEY